MEGIKSGILVRIYPRFELVLFFLYEEKYQKSEAADQDQALFHALFCFARLANAS
jgi:hypothetical protein